MQIIKNDQKNIKKSDNNRFNLILIASKRARQIQLEERETFIKKTNKNKCTVIALKEIEKTYDFL